MAVEKGNSGNSTQELFSLYEKALASLHSGHYESAMGIFDELEENYPAELDVLSRARDFRRLCERRLQQNQSGGNGNGARTANDCYDFGVFLHNAGRLEEALEAFRHAQSLADTELPFVHYAMAATNARLGNTAEALSHLKKAITLAPESRFAVCNDPDFNSLVDEGGFRELLGDES